MSQLASVGLASLVAGAVAAIVWLIIATPWRATASRRMQLAWIVGLAVGVYAGCAMLRQWPQWPPGEDRQRLLTILLPLAVAIDAALFAIKRPWIAGVLRLAMAASISPALLYRTSYLADLAGPGSAEWSTSVAALHLLSTAAIVVLVWTSLAKWQSRTTDTALAAVLAITAVAAGVTVVLSGYLLGGLVGVIWASALTSIAVASVAFDRPQAHGQFLAVAMLGIGGVLVMGRYFGALALPQALAIAFAPTMVWLGEIPRLQRLPARLRLTLQASIVSLPLLIVVMNAALKFFSSVSMDDLDGFH